MQYIPQPVPLPNEIRGGAVFIWENAVPDWQEIIKGFEDKAADPNSGLFFENAKTQNGDWAGRRRNKIMHFSAAAHMGDKFAIEMHNKVGLLISNYLTYYSKYFETTFNMLEGFSLLKYSGATNDHYDAHYDGGPSNNRWISAIIYLNSDYEGGELEFPDHVTKIKPKNGTLVLFPSNYAYRHIAHDVTQGTKYAIVTWIAANE